MTILTHLVTKSLALHWSNTAYSPRFAARAFGGYIKRFGSTFRMYVIQFIDWQSESKADGYNPPEMYVHMTLVTAMRAKSGTACLPGPRNMAQVRWQRSNVQKQICGKCGNE